MASFPVDLLAAAQFCSGFSSQASGRQKLVGSEDVQSRRRQRQTPRRCLSGKLAKGARYDANISIAGRGRRTKAAVGKARGLGGKLRFDPVTAGQRRGAPKRGLRVGGTSPGTIFRLKRPYRSEGDSHG
jgi:hypothetical protein